MGLVAEVGVDACEGTCILIQKHHDRPPSILVVVSTIVVATKI